MTTSTFKVGASIYTKTVFRNFFARYWWCYALPIIVASMLTAINHNFAIVILALLFIVYPMTFSLAYFSYCITEEIIWSISAKKISINHSGLLLDFESRKRLLRWTDLKKVELKSNFLLLTLSNRKFTYLIIPFNAIPSPKALHYFIEYLGANINIREK